MITKDFEQVIQKISPRFTIVPNPNRAGLNNIFFDGRNYDLPVVANDVREEIDNAYRYEFPNGYSSRMWSQGEITARLEAFLEQFNKGDLNDIYNEK